MNIKNRLNKLEDKTGVSGEFCQCKETRKTEIRYEGAGNSSLHNTIVPDECELCRKPIEKDIIIIQFVESKITKPGDVYEYQ